MALNYQTAVQTARLGCLTTALGSGPYYLEIFTGTPPGKTGTTFNADTGTKLASMPGSTTPDTVTNNILTFNAITTENALASGTPGYARFKTAQNGAASTVIIECTCGVGSGDINFNSALTSGGAVSITSASISEGNNG